MKSEGKYMRTYREDRLLGIPKMSKSAKVSDGINTKFLS